MGKKIQNIILDSVKIIEVILAVLLMVAIIISTWRIAMEIINMPGQAQNIESFEAILGNMFSLIIGLEFIKMICKYTPDTIIEVLLFTVARYLVVNHSSAINSLLGVIAIGCIFAIKKYIFNTDKAQ